MLARTVPPAGTKNGFSYYMHPIAKDTKCKLAFLLLSIKHPSMENIIDNLQTKENLTYELANHTLLAITQSRTSSYEAEVLTANCTPPSSRSTKICM